MSDYPITGEDGFVELSDSSPAAPGGNVNVTWQRHAGLSSGPGDLPALSGYVPVNANPATPNTKFHSWSPVAIGAVGDDNTLTSYYLSTSGYNIANIGCTSTFPCSVTLQIQGGGGSYALGGETAFSSVRYGAFLAAQAALTLNQVTTIRLWFGISSSSGAGLQADDLGAAGIYFAGFRFSTNASDTNFQCVTSDASSQTTTDSMVAADANPHTFKIVNTGSSYQFYIDGNLVATNATHLPSTGVGASDVCQIDGPGSSSGTFGVNVGYISWWDTL